MRWRRRSADDFSEEIRAHIAHETDRLIAEGMSPDEAALAARRKFGNVDCRRPSGSTNPAGGCGSTSCSRTFTPRGAISSATPSSPSSRCCSLGAGIGATAASLTIRDVIFQNPPPLYADPSSCRRCRSPGRIARSGRSAAYVPGDLYPEVAQRDRPVDRRVGPETRAYHGRTHGGPRRAGARARSVTANLFTVLGVAPEIGTAFLGRGRERCGSRLRPSSATGSGSNGSSAGPMRSASTIWIDSQPHTVIGVMPRRFWFSELGDPIWTLLEPGTLTADTDLLVVVRRPDRHERRRARRDSCRDPSPRTRASSPAGEGPLKMRLSAIKGTPIAEQMSAMLPYVLGTAVLLTLLIACANVAILMIAQWTRREAETAMRSALGASRCAADSGHGRRVGAAGLVRGTPRHLRDAMRCEGSC